MYFDLPATCVWTAVNTDGSEFLHPQFFVMAEAGIAIDISYSPGVEQVMGTFHSGLSSHLTTCSLYVHNETGQMTTTFLNQSPTEEFMPDPDAPGLGVWIPKKLPGWR